MNDATFAKKTERNVRVQARYDELMREGKHGHYETMFRVVREEVERAQHNPLNTNCITPHLCFEPCGDCAAAKRSVVYRLRNGGQPDLADEVELELSRAYAEGRKDEREDLSAPWVDVRGCGWHHYTPENIAAIVRDLKLVERGERPSPWIDGDMRTRCGILWRVISALSHEVPLNPEPVIASDALPSSPSPASQNGD